ncbi:HYR domain-containing protein, partial [Aureisphaera sp.]
MKSTTKYYGSILVLLLALLFGFQIQAQTATAQGSNTSGFVFIPGNDTAGANRNVTISGIPPGAAITNVEVRLAVFHRFIGDLIMEVTDPNGETITLVDRPGTTGGTNGDGSDLFRTSPITFSDSFTANPEEMGNTLGTSEVVCRDDGICDYRAFQSGTAFAGLIANINNNGLSANGTWQVNVADVASGDDDGNFTVPYIRVTFTTVDLAVFGSDFDEDFVVVRDGNETVVTANGTEISRVLSAGLSSLTINALGGDDVLTVDMDGGDFPHPIIFNGGDQNGTPGDVLQLNGTASSYASIAHNFTNENDGSIEVSGNSMISYTGLEPVIDNLDAADRTFVFNGGAETITLDDGGTLDLRIDSTLGEMVDFNEPTGSLSIFSGDGDDTINLEGFTATEDFGLFVLGGNAGDATLDVVNFQTNPTSINGFVSISADQITMNADLTSADAITFISERQTTINSGIVLESTASSIDIDAGTSTVTTLNHVGFRCNNCTVRTADGNIDITATGKSNGTSSNQSGIFVNNNGLITTTGTGNISLDGTGGDGVNRNYGTALSDARVFALGGGDITMTGDSGSSTGEFNIGVRLLETDVTVTTGNLSMDGTSNNTANGNQNIGIWLQGPSNIRSNDGGNMTFEGTGGIGPNGSNAGVIVFSDIQIFNDTTSGSITMTGNGGDEGDINDGIYIQDENTLISTNGGGLSLTGTGGDSTDGIFNTGIYVASGTLRDQGSGLVQLNGTAGDCDESSDGIFITQNTQTTLVTANGGGISMTGVGQTSAGAFSAGVYILGGLVEELGSGDIDIIGTAGSGTNVTAGIVIASDATEPTIRANGGDITMGGQGGTSTAGNFSDGVILQNGNVIASGTGNILVDGISGTSTGTKTEGVYWEETVIRSEDGNINVVGDCEDNSGTENAGVYMINPNFETTGTGNATIRGASLDASIPGVDQISRDRVNTAGGDITITGVVGEIQTPDGNAAALYTATNVNFFGRLAPGQSPGRILLTGNLIFPASATLEIEIDAFTNSGTDYDNITVQSGDVNLGGATLDLVDNTSEVADGSEVLTLIDNGGSNPVTGTFNGLPNDSAIAFNGETWYLYYNGGDGNDVVLQTTRIVTNVEVDAGGNLVFNDPDGEDDDLTIIVDGTDYRISDANRALIAGAGATQDGDDVLVPIASVTGNINVNTQDGDDSLTLDFDGGDFDNNVEYDGGGQTTAAGDILQFTGGGTYDRITHTFFNESDGWVLLDTGAFLAFTTTYLNLEPVVDNLDIVDREFVFSASDETITLDAGGNLDLRIDSDFGEMVEFTNPTGSLDINAGNGDDIINIEGLDANFDADLIIEGGSTSDVDTVNFQTTATNLASGDLTANNQIEFINITADITTTGNITTNSTDDTLISGANVTTTDGAISITSGSAPTSGLNYHGLDINNADVQATGTGSVTLNGTGNNAGTANSLNGVYIQGNSTVSTTSGALNITGNGPAAGGNFNIGFRIDGPAVAQTTNGTINAIGNGSDGTGLLNAGIALAFDGTLQATGTGSVTMTGTGGSNASTNSSYGVLFQEGLVFTAGGGSIINGIGGDGTANDVGVVFFEGSQVADTQNGNIQITGTGGQGGNGNSGIISNLTPASSITSNNGNIILTGQGSTTATGNNNLGISLGTSMSITSTGTGSVTLNGTGGPGVNNNAGVALFGSTQVRSNGGGITVSGTGGTATGSANDGIQLVNTTLLDNTSGNVRIDGLGGRGTDFNGGVYLLGASNMVQSTDGDLIMIGESVDSDGSVNDAIYFDAAGLQTTGSGNIVITGLTPSNSYAAVSLNTNNSLVNSANDVTISTFNGALTSLVGVPTNDLITGANFNLNGDINAGGANIGVFPIAGNSELLNNGQVQIRIDDFTTPGTDYDQLSLTGTLTLTDTNLGILDNSTGATAFEVLTIIDNDGTDAIVGTFNGIPNGSQVGPWYVYYDQGDGNDVVLRSSPINVYVDTSGNMIFTDNLGDDDELTLVIDGTNYRISDPNKPVIAGIGATQDGDDALVPIVSVTGTIDINTLEGDDSLNVDLDGGDFGDVIAYDGGNQNSTPGDVMILSGTSLFTTVSHTFTNENDGSVSITGNSNIDYVGLEPITDNLDATNRNFTFNGGAETITLDAGGSLDNRIDSTLGELVEFTNPTNNLTIDAGSEDDRINIQGVDANFDANLTIVGGMGEDISDFNTNDTNIGSGTFNIQTDGFVAVGADLITTGSIFAVCEDEVFLSGSTLQITDGTININANAAPTDPTTNTVGFFMTSSNIIATGTGSIILAGIGSNNGSGNFGQGIVIANTGISTQSGSISITGTGSSDATVDQNFGITINGNASIIESVDGDITITGTGGTASGSANMGTRIFSNAVIQTTGTGSVTITGNGGTGNASNFGLLMDSDAAITTNSGILTLNGTAQSTASAGNDGIRFEGATASSTSGEVIVTGTAASTSNAGVYLFNTSNVITTTDDITINSVTGPLASTTGTITGDLLDAANVVINGDLSPGLTSAGYFPVAGDLVLTSGEQYLLNINGLNPGTEYDQLSVTGTVDITDAVLGITDATVITNPFEALTIIENDGTDPIVGTFAGLPQGTAIGNWFIYYDGGDGNDVVLRSGAVNVYVDGSDNMVFEDTTGEDDELTIIIDGGNYRVSDPNKAVVAGNGATQDGNDALVPIASVIGDININTLEGDDSLNIDLDGGDFDDIINYDGGNQNSTPGDFMILSGTNTVTNTTHNFTDATSGSVSVTGNSLFNYTGLEPIIDNLDASTRNFNFNGGAETITIDAGGSLDNRIDSTLGELVEFNNPIEFVFISPGSGSDIINVEGVDADFEADLIIIDNDAEDTINFQTNATNIGGGSNITATAEYISITEDVSVIGLGRITMRAATQLTVTNNAVVSSEDFGIQLRGNTSGITGGAIDLDGLVIDNATVQATGIGSVVLSGVGRGTGTTAGNNGIVLQNNAQVTGLGQILIFGTGGDGTNNNNGVRVESNSIIESFGSRTINVNGLTSNTSGNNNNGIYLVGGGSIRNGAGDIELIGESLLDGNNLNMGIRIDGPSAVTTGDGNIDIEGTGAPGTGNLNIGIVLLNDGTVQSTGAGSVTLTGNGTSGTDANYGILNQSGQVLTAGGGITMTGNGGAGTTFQSGTVFLQGGTAIDSDDGDITINGTAGSGTSDSRGVVFGNTPSCVVTTNDGNISINGQAGTGGGNANIGVFIANESQISSTGTGAVSIIGTGGTGDSSNDGIFIFDRSSVITNGGGITMTGSANSAATGGQNMGIEFNDSSIVQDNATGAVSLTGQGGGGVDNNRGLNILGSGTLVTSAGGDIQLMGTANANTTGENNTGTTINTGANVGTLDTGVVTITGTGGGGSDSNIGVQILNNASQVATVNGNLTITGTATDTAGDDQNGISLTSQIGAMGTGEVILNGTAGLATSAGIAFSNNNADITTGGNVTLNTTTGPITTPAGVPTADLINAVNLEINGETRAGFDNIGVFPIAANTALSSGDNVVFGISGFTTAGTDYDQWVITGTVDITDATFTIDDQTGAAEDSCETIILIDNDGADAIIGTFNGVPEGASVSFGNITGKVSYVGGDGNDFVLNLDDTPPVAVCQDITIALDSTGQISIVAADVDGGSTDNCGIDTLSIDIDTFDCDDLGDNDVVLTVTDVNGNVATCTAVVTVIDITFPTITCAPDGTRDTDPGLCQYTVQGTEFDATFGDNCGASTTLTNDFNNSNTLAGAILSPGETQVTWTATDSSGNIVSCIVTITVEDNEDPIVTCASDATRDTDPGICEYRVIGDEFDPVSATDNCGINTVTNDFNNEASLDGALLPLGDTTVTWTVDDGNGQAVTCQVTITVEDNEAPTITCAADGTRDTDAGVCEYTVQGTEFDATFSDNCTTATVTNDYNNADTLDGAVLPLGDTVVTWTVDDGNGQTATCQVTITVEDNEAPTITCAADGTRDTDAGVCEYTVQGTEFDATFSDNCTTATITNDYNNTDTLNGAVLPLGDTVVTWTVDDGNGQTATCQVTITVEDNEAPTITCAADGTRDTDPGVCEYTVQGTEFDATFSDNCTTATVTNDYNNTDTLDGAVLPLGDTVVIWTVDDGNGQTATCQVTITVEDNEAPTITCAADGTRDTDAGVCEYTVQGTEFDATFSDNCTTATIINDYTNTDTLDGAVLPLGDTVVTWTVDDGNGQTATCQVTIT